MSPLYLERVRPLARAGQRIELSGAVARCRIGRGAEADIALYTPSAHREHAVLRLDDAGWILHPLSDAEVRVDGRLVREDLRLVEGMHLAFGADELRVRSTAEAAEEEFVDPLIAAPSRSSRGSRMASWAAAVLILVAIGWWWLG